MSTSECDVSWRLAGTTTTEHVPLPSAFHPRGSNGGWSAHSDEQITVRVVRCDVVRSLSYTTRSHVAHAVGMRVKENHQGSGRFTLVVGRVYHKNIPTYVYRQFLTYFCAQGDFAWTLP